MLVGVGNFSGRKAIPPLLQRKRQIQRYEIQGLKLMTSCELRSLDSCKESLIPITPCGMNSLSIWRC